MRPCRVAYAPSARRMLDSNVLVLNRSYLPIHVTSVRRAFSLIYRGTALAVNGSYETFDFDGLEPRRRRTATKASGRPTERSGCQE